MQRVCDAAKELITAGVTELNTAKETRTRFFSEMGTDVILGCHVVSWPHAADDSNSIIHCLRAWAAPCCPTKMGTVVVRGTLSQRLE